MAAVIVVVRLVVIVVAVVVIGVAGRVRRNRHDRGDVRYLDVGYLDVGFGGNFDIRHVDGGDDRDHVVSVHHPPFDVSPDVVTCRGVCHGHHKDNDGEAYLFSGSHSELLEAARDEDGGVDPGTPA